MANLKVLVVGASVAGPSTAYWFARAGAKVTVIERFAALRKGGQNIDIRTVGVTVMRKIPGMEAAVRASKAPIEGFTMVDGNGKPFIEFKATGDPDKQSLVSEYEIFRGDLAKILYDYSSEHENVKYIFNEQVSSMRQSGDEEDGPVTVEFANGTPTDEFDLVVACDGATSRTRALGLQCGVRDHIRSLNGFASYFSIKADLLDGSKVSQGLTAVKGRCLFVGPDHDPKVNRVLAGLVYPSKVPDATRPYREASAQGTDAVKKFVFDRLTGMGWKSDTVLRLMMDSDDFYASEMLWVEVPTLHKGRFVLVGDAGYAGGGGTGTSLAMCGAYVLAGEVGVTHRGDIAAGLRAYQERMEPIIKDLQTLPPGFPAIMAPWTAWGLWARNWAVRLFMFFMMLGKKFAWLTSWYSGAFAGGDKYKLPDYKFEE